MHLCPVCGYPDLFEAPRSASGGGSYEICPSCGFQFGVDDDDKGISHEQWREKWVAGGMKWHSQGNAAPKGWDANKQLAALVPGKAKVQPKESRKVKPKPKPKAKTKPVPKKAKALPKKAKVAVKKKATGVAPKKKRKSKKR